MRLRRRRLALALAASAAVHLAALIVLAPTFDAQQARGEIADAPTTTLQLIELPNLRPPAPAPSPARAPAPTTPTANVASAPGPPSAQASPAAGAASGDDGLYRVVFHDAVGQADAGMRAGLGCAHVDLHKLPGTVLALCDVASRRPADVALAIASRPTAPVWDRDWGALVDARGASARHLPSLEAARDADKGVPGRGE